MISLIVVGIILCMTASVYLFIEATERQQVGHGPRRRGVD